MSAWKPYVHATSDVKDSSDVKASSDAANKPYLEEVRTFDY